MTVAARNGFTLVEMLVALSVFAIAALALLRLDGFAVATAADLQGRLAAGLEAENEAALLSTDPGPVTLGASSTVRENAGRRFRIDRRITPTADRRLLRVDLLVTELGYGSRAALIFIKRVG